MSNDTNMSEKDKVRVVSAAEWLKEKNKDKMYPTEYYWFEEDIEKYAEYVSKAFAEWVHVTDWRYNEDKKYWVDEDMIKKTTAELYSEFMERGK